MIGRLARAIFRSQNKTKLFVLLILCFCSIALADNFKAIDGKEYKNVTVSRVEPDGIVLVSHSGISKVYFTELAKEVQERFHYDAAKAAAYSNGQAASQEPYQQQQEDLRRKVAEERNKYWIGQEPLKKQEDKLRAPAAPVADRGKQGEVIAHGARVDIVKHLALGNVTVVDFYADWCGPCKRSRQAWSRWHKPIRRLRCARSTSSIGKRPSCSNTTSARFRR